MVTEPQKERFDKEKHGEWWTVVPAKLVRVAERRLPHGNTWSRQKRRKKRAHQKKTKKYR